ncbi:MAG TPA: hypothetical protein VHE61_05160 [Opitutaceae bacterium]|nr:hypothetical protein [Opitutaceae bacterium]
MRRASVRHYLVWLIKACLGMHRFLLLRGLAKTSLEWSLVFSAYNLKRLYFLKTTLQPA